VKVFELLKLNQISKLKTLGKSLEFINKMEVKIFAGNFQMFLKSVGLYQTQM